MSVYVCAASGYVRYVSDITTHNLNMDTIQAHTILINGDTPQPSDIQTGLMSAWPLQVMSSAASN